jgi:hypothetical protein
LKPLHNKFEFKIHYIFQIKIVKLILKSILNLLFLCLPKWFWFECELGIRICYIHEELHQILVHFLKMLIYVQDHGMILNWVTGMWGHQLIYVFLTWERTLLLSMTGGTSSSPLVPSVHTSSSWVSSPPRSTLASRRCERLVLTVNNCIKVRLWLASVQVSHRSQGTLLTSSGEPKVSNPWNKCVTQNLIY